MRSASQCSHDQLSRPGCGQAYLGQPVLDRLGLLRWPVWPWRPPASPSALRGGLAWRACARRPCGGVLARARCGALAGGFLPPPRAARASSSATASSSVIVSGVMSDGQRGVDAVMADIGAIAAVLDHDRRRPCRDGRPATARDRRRTAALARALAFFSAISVTARLRPTVSTSSPGLEIGVGLAVLDIGAEAADAGQDRLAVFRDACRPRAAATAAPSARSRSTSSGAEPFGNAGALGLLALDRLAELDVGAEAAVAQRDLEAASPGSSPSTLAMPPSAAPSLAARRRAGGCSGIPDSSSSR